MGMGFLSSLLIFLRRSEARGVFFTSTVVVFPYWRVILRTVESSL